MNIDDFGPAYEFGGPNEEVCLLPRTQAHVGIEDLRFSGSVEVFLVFLPQPRIVARGTFHNVPSDVASKAGTFLDSLFSDRCMPRVFVDGRDWNDGTVAEGVPCIRGQASQILIQEPDRLIVEWDFGRMCWSGSKDSVMSSLVFHLPHFLPPPVFGSGDFSARETGAWNHFEVDLASRGWQVRIKPLPRTARTKVGFHSWRTGFSMVGVGCVQRSDRSVFTATQAKELLYLLDSVISFAKGCAWNSFCPAGYDEKGNLVWGEWSCPTPSFGVGASWFDPAAPEQLRELFPGFARKMLDADWKGPLGKTIEWLSPYIGGSRGPEADYILAFAALEKLAFTYVVQKRQLISKEGFDRLVAADKFRLLFSSLGIPTKASQQEHVFLEDVLRPAQTRWSDIPQALVEIRNVIVHAERGKSYDFGALSLYGAPVITSFVDLVVLGICGYRGVYKDRCSGDTKPVPWADKEQAPDSEMPSRF